MKGLEKHISELLYHHDCVILPGIGGFIIHFNEGEYQRSSSRLLPPARRVSFNGLLTSDDGLLIQHICQQENMDYAAGKEIFKTFASHLMNEAATTAGARLEGIGTFRLSLEKKLIFTPATEANFLESSFGLTPVQALHFRPVKETAARERTMKPRVDRLPSGKHEKTPAPVRWTVITTVPIILFLLWGILFPVSFQHTYTSYSGLLTDLFIEKPANPGNTVNLAGAESWMDIFGLETIGPLQPIGSKEITVQSVTEHPEIKEAPAVHPDFFSSLPAAMAYYVIGGVFRSEENAQRYVDALNALGYRSKLVGTNGQGHHRVCYDSFATWKEAEDFLAIIKAGENPSAWILKY